MGKYALIASHYDRNRGEFLNEIKIDVPNIDLTNLDSIDHFTSQYDDITLMKEVLKYNTLTNQNFFSIRYLKSNDSRPIYYKIIYHNELITKLSSKVEVKLIGNKQHSYAQAVPQNVDFAIEFKKIEEMLDRRDIDQLVSFFGEFHPLVSLARNYLSCDPYDYEGLDQCKKMVKQEFSRYKTFRGWIVSKEKRNVKNFNRPIVPKVKQKPIITKTVEENEQDYINQYNNEHQITYEEQKALDYNTNLLDEDKEEFIEPDEMEQMGYGKTR